MVEQVYRPRRPRESPLWQCLCAHFYDFVQAYPEKYEKKYGFLKPVVEDVEEAADVDVIDVSDYHPPRIPSKKWRELIKSKIPIAKQIGEGLGS